MKLYRLALLTVGLFSCPLSNAGSDDVATALGLPAEVGAAMRDIDPRRISAHVKFLADDLLEGRGTGTRGGDIAAQYIASQFASYGLKPGGRRRHLPAEGGVHGRHDIACQRRSAGAPLRVQQCLCNSVQIM